jgi:hypothetical protein
MHCVTVQLCCAWHKACSAVQVQLNWLLTCALGASERSAAQHSCCQLTAVYALCNGAVVLCMAQGM